MLRVLCPVTSYASDPPEPRLCQGLFSREMIWQVMQHRVVALVDCRMVVVVDASTNPHDQDVMTLNLARILSVNVSPKPCPVQIGFPVERLCLGVFPPSIIAVKVGQLNLEMLPGVILDQRVAIHDAVKEFPPLQSKVLTFLRLERNPLPRRAHDPVWFPDHPATVLVRLARLH